MGPSGLFLSKRPLRSKKDLRGSVRKKGPDGLSNKFEERVLLFFFKTYLDPLGSRRVLKKKKDTALRVFYRIFPSNLFAKKTGLFLFKDSPLLYPKGSRRKSLKKKTHVVFLTCKPPRLAGLCGGRKHLRCLQPPLSIS